MKELTWWSKVVWKLKSTKLTHLQRKLEVDKESLRRRKVEKGNFKKKKVN